MTSSLLGASRPTSLLRPCHAGRDRAPSAELVERVERRMIVGMLLAHGLGALDVLLLLLFVLPAPPGHTGADVLDGLHIGWMALYFVVVFLVTWFVATRYGRRTTTWIATGRPPTASERLSILRRPMVCTGLDMLAWIGGTIVFIALNVSTSAALTFHIGGTVLLGGLTTCAIAYLVSERIQRPMTAYALAARPVDLPERAARPAVGPGVKGRLVLAWTCATGVPLFGILIVGVQALTDPAVDPARVAASVIVLGVMALVLGLGMMLVAAHSVAGPLRAMRRAVALVEDGDLDAFVRVEDSSEVGLLQSGFNRMAAGLREREQIRDLFGRHVGEDVARAALDGAGPSLDSGEVREVAALFVDLVGSTAMAAQRPPTEVVALLNRFFAVIVEVVGRHGGFVNKFEGDAALCVFGAPARQDDAACRALTCARELDRRLRADLPEAVAGIGLSSGPAVAGWVGAEARLEYTVLGDPVNEAARLCDLAKRSADDSSRGRVLASEAILQAAAEIIASGVATSDECERWALGDEIVLRGRPLPTRLASPA